jgi:YrbI family 3-deoxy-D-manno-octulosonate 8-phosphate phosphatase
MADKKIIVKKSSGIKLLLSDVDGVLTDGGMYYSESGDELKKFNTRDGGGFILLKNVGIKTGMITSENVKLVERRAKKLEVDYYFSVSGDKWKTIDQLLQSLHLEPANLAYIGDDINDLTVIEKAGLSFAPSDGVEEVQKKANVVLSRKGGEGAVREAAELILKSSGKYEEALSQYLKSRKKHD